MKSPGQSPRVPIGNRQQLAKLPHKTSPMNPKCA
jgi:hypothetical protein